MLNYIVLTKQLNTRRSFLALILHNKRKTRKHEVFDVVIKNNIFASQ